MTSHSNFIETELAQFHGLLKKIRLRLSRHLNNQGKEWIPDPEFMNSIKSLADALFKSSSEWRKVAQSNGAHLSQLTDARLDALVSEAVMQEASKLSDDQFAQLLHQRQRDTLNLRQQELGNGSDVGDHSSRHGSPNDYP